MNKIKLVWICHFSNEEVKSILKPWRNILEFAPWMPMAIETMENNQKYELTVVAPYAYITGIKRFKLRGVNYVFFNANMPFVGINWPRWFPWDYMTDFYTNKKKMKRIIDDIHPDIIHLFGAENHDYSPLVLPLLGKYPIVLTVQGFLSHTTQKFGYIERKVATFEKQIIRSIPIIFFEQKKQKEDILEINPNAIMHWHTYGSYEIDTSNLGSFEKEYDIAFWGRINRDKGIVDLLQAIKIIKEKYNKIIKTCIIGKPSNDEFYQIAEELGIADQLIWAGFLPTRNDVFKLALKAKICVLPTYHDVMPGTIMESMFLGIPVVSYATDSIPEINEDYEAICLVERGNVEKLAESIVTIIKDKEKTEYYSVRGKKRAYEMFAPSKEELVNRLDVAYQEAIKGFKFEHYE